MLAVYGAYTSSSEYALRVENGIMPLPHYKLQATFRIGVGGRVNPLNLVLHSIQP